jgi:hypothetical protein
MTDEIKHKFSGLLSINRPNGIGGSGGYDIETNHIVPPVMGSNVSSRANSVHSGSLKTYEDGSGRHPLQAELETSAERMNEMNALNRAGSDGEGRHHNETSSPRHNYGESTPFGLSNNNNSNNNNGNNNNGGYSSEKEQRTPDRRRPQTPFRQPKPDQIPGLHQRDLSGLSEDFGGNGGRNTPTQQYYREGCSSSSLEQKFDWMSRKLEDVVTAVSHIQQQQQIQQLHYYQQQQQQQQQSSPLAWTTPREGFSQPTPPPSTSSSSMSDVLRTIESKLANLEENERKLAARNSALSLGLATFVGAATVLGLFANSRK